VRGWRTPGFHDRYPAEAGVENRPGALRRPDVEIAPDQDVPGKAVDNVLVVAAFASPGAADHAEEHPVDEIMIISRGVLSPLAEPVAAGGGELRDGRLSGRPALAFTRSARRAAGILRGAPKAGSAPAVP
jgi:hypothetical protein